MQVQSGTEDFQDEINPITNFLFALKKTPETMFFLLYVILLLIRVFQIYSKMELPFWDSIKKAVNK
jgi:hypothetical protein